MTTWLDAIDANGFDEWTRTTLIIEAQRTRFPGDLPAGFGFRSDGSKRCGWRSSGSASAFREPTIGCGTSDRSGRWSSRLLGMNRSHFPTAGGNASWCSPQTRAMPEVASRGRTACLG